MRRMKTGEIYCVRESAGYEMEDHKQNEDIREELEITMYI
jgi:hypothetical protein